MQSTQPTPKKSGGCLKTGLFVVVGFFALFFIVGLVGNMAEDVASVDVLELSDEEIAAARELSVKDSTERADALQTAEKLTDKLKTKTDDFEESTYYYGNNIIPYTNTNRLLLYMGKQPDSRPWLRLRVQYAADDWLFVEGVELKIDGQRRELRGLGRFERDNDAGQIWEWSDTKPSEYNLGVLSEVANSKKTTIRYNGSQYRKDRTITSSEKKALREVLAAFDAWQDVY